MKPFGTSATWEDAITNCYSSSYGGQTPGTWRLPTQKELMQAYINGIWTLKNSNHLNLNTNYIWSSTTESTSVVDAWYVSLAFGFSASGTKTSNQSFLCVN
jgi:hypothetical protein